MANEVTDAFDSAFRDFATAGVPSSGRNKVKKAEVRSIGPVIDDQIAELQAQIDAVESYAATGAKWAALGPVALATTGNVTLSGEQTIDGTLTSASRILVKSQSTPSQNGLYTTGGGAWSRTADADTAAEMLGLAVSVNGGSANAGKSFICQGVAPITLGSTALPFAETENQSSFTNAVNALSDDIEAVDEKVDGLLAPMTGQQIIGVASPASGSNASASSYVHAKEVEFDGVATSVELYAGVAGTVEIGVFSRSASDVFTRLRHVTGNVSVGLNTIPIRLSAERDNYVGLTVSLAGTLQYITATNHGYFAGTLVGEAFTDTASSPSLEPQFKFVIDQVDTKPITEVLAEGGTIEQVVGKDGTPTSGTNNAANGSIVPNNPALSDGLIETIEFYSAAASTVVIGLYERSGITMTRVETLARVTTNPGALNTFRVDAPISVGQYIGLQSATGGFITYNDTVGDGYFYGATTSGSSFDHSAANTAATMEFRAIIRRISKSRHTVNLANVDRILLLGPSYGAGHYNQRGKNWISKVSLFSDFTVENFSYSGETVATLLDRIRTGTVNSYAKIPPAGMNIAYAIIMEGWNSADVAGSNDVTFAEYQADIRQMIETLKSLGAVPILASEWQPVYDASAHAVYKALAQEMGVMYLDLIPHSLRNAQGTAYADFWRPATGVRHFGVRTNHIVSDQVERYLAQLGRPANAIKLFRKRTGITVSDIDDDLMFVDDYERGERFREIYLNQVAITEATEKYYDELVSSSASYDQNSVVQSEYLTLQNAGAISLADYGLLDVVIDAVPRNVELFRLAISDPDIEVYVKDALAGGTYPADGKSVCRWTQLTGSDGVFGLSTKDLPGKMQFDKLSFLLYKSGGFTLSQPRIEWWGDAGKPSYPINVKQERATGAELLNVTKFAAISGNKATGWDNVGGTITPSAVTTYQLPYNTTHFITVDDTEKVVQTLNYSMDNFNDIEVEIRVTARSFPAVFASSGSYPSTAPINQDSFDWRKVVVELIDPTGTFVFTQKAKVGLWWDEVVFRAILPMRVNPLDIRVSGDEAVQITEVSVKRLQ